MDGLAKVIKKGAANGTDPEMIKLALNNTGIFGSQYKRVNLLMDLGDLENVKGLGMAVANLKHLENSAASLKGFRYEIEGAAWLRRNEYDVIEMTKKVSVDWEAGLHGAKTGRTDIDVVVKVGEELIYYQFKSSKSAMQTLRKNMAWVAKVLKEQADQNRYDLVKYALPNGVADLRSTVKVWFDKVGIEAIAIPHLD